jgi:hypothetical protein
MGRVNTDGGSMDESVGTETGSALPQRTAGTPPVPVAWTRFMQAYSGEAVSLCPLMKAA